MNRDNLLENTSGGGETGEIIRNVRDSNYQIHLYYTSLDISTYSIRQTEAFAFGTSGYFSKRHKDSVNNLAAHEIGHILGRSGHNSALGTLMQEFSGHPGYPDPCRILKTDWDLVNPNTP